MTAVSAPVRVGRQLSETPDRSLTRDLLDHHANAPVVAEVQRGEEGHIGGGVFLRRCTDCDDYTLTAGPSIWTTDMQKHLLRHYR